MKKTNIISTALTDEDFDKFKQAWLEAETKSGERINVSTFLRDTVMGVINGQSPPSVPETIKETKESVSPVMWDTDFMDDWDIKQKKE